MKAFKIRASEAGKIMASPKKNELPVGAQTYLREWYISEKYGRRMPVRTDLMDNGIRCEEQSISLCLLYTSPSPRDGLLSRMPSSA